MADLFGFDHPLTPTGRRSRALPTAALIKVNRDKQRKREQRAQRAAQEGRKLRNYGMSPEQRRQANIELKRQRRLERAQAEGRLLKVKLHDRHVKDWTKHQRQEQQRQLDLHDSHVREWKSDDARLRRWQYHHVAKANIYHRLKRWMHKHMGDRLPSRKWSQYLGYTTDELCQHIERQFQKGMTWDNKGEWHIDHIIPVSSFKIESVHDPAFRVCFGLSNLRPIWAKDNMSKADKRIYLI